MGWLGDGVGGTRRYAGGIGRCVILTCLLSSEGIRMVDKIEFRHPLELVEHDEHAQLDNRDLLENRPMILLNVRHHLGLKLVRLGVPGGGGVVVRHVVILSEVIILRNVTRWDSAGIHGMGRDGCPRDGTRWGFHGMGRE